MKPGTSLNRERVACAYGAAVGVVLMVVWYFWPQGLLVAAGALFALTGIWRLNTLAAEWTDPRGPGAD